MGEHLAPVKSEMLYRIRCYDDEGNVLPDVYLQPCGMLMVMRLFKEWIAEKEWDNSDDAIVLSAAYHIHTFAVEVYDGSSQEIEGSAKRDHSSFRGKKAKRRTGTEAVPEPVRPAVTKVRRKQDSSAPSVDLDQGRRSEHPDNGQLPDGGIANGERSE